MPFFSSDPSIGVSHTADKSSFAYSTVRERWPKIIRSAIDDVIRSQGLKERSVDEKEEGAVIVKKLERLLSDMANDADLEPLAEVGPDIESYNEELRLMGPFSWQNSPWLYLECYLYRLVNIFFGTCNTSFWRNYDVFENVKNDSLPTSKTGAIELVTWFWQTINDSKIKIPDDATHQALIEEMLEISLWGNATDLSLLTTISMEELHSRQGKEARDSSKKNVIVNDTKEVWKLLEALLKKASSPRLIHIVLDNSGFELLADLILAVHLLSSGYATQVTLHGKAMPWFVSDVTARDLDFLITGLVAGSMFEGLSQAQLHDLEKFGIMLQKLLFSKRMIYEAHHFWTTQHSFGRMLEVAPDLYDRLSGAELVIFKGDLNYRKLVADGMWPKVTSFKESLGVLGEQLDGKGLRILALRGCKADVVVGLKAGQEKQLEKESKEWMRTGKYAVISYYNTKDGV